MTTPKRILLTGGGTAGHVTPNLALIPKLRDRGFIIRYAGTKEGIERDLIESERVPFDSIAAGKLRRYKSFANITDLFRIAAGFFQSLLIVARYRPHVLFSKGGFVSCPVVWAARLMGVPIIIHESDISPGLANRLSLPFAKTICFSFPETAAYLSGRNAVLTGIPVRESLLRGDPARGKSLCGFCDSKPVLMVIGGSQGAQAINTCVRQALDRLLPEFNVCHICGRGNTINNRAGYRQFEFVGEDLAHLFSVADAVISRAGATTLFELLALRKPNLLIPLPRSASRGDQILNAQSFEKQGFSRVLLQEAMSPETLVQNIEAVLKNSQEIIDRMDATNVLNGTDKIIGLIDAAAGKRVARP